MRKQLSARSGSTAELQPKEANKTQTKKYNERVAVGNAVFLLSMPHSVSEQMHFFPHRTIDRREIRNLHRKQFDFIIFHQWVRIVVPDPDIISLPVISIQPYSRCSRRGFPCALGFYRFTVSDVTNHTWRNIFRGDSECDRMLFHAAPSSTR